MDHQENITVERHPLQPFIPTNAKLLMLGSFPPPQKRWSINFFYPNLQNDMWRIFGILFRHDKNAFVDIPDKKFRKQEIIDLLQDKGIAIYDTACAVKRLQGNASDKFLEIVTPTNIFELIDQMPCCKAIVTTGQKATDTLCDFLSVTAPRVGQGHKIEVKGKSLLFFRMPSSSRAYPMKIEDKATAYKKMFEEIGMISR